MTEDQQNLLIIRGHIAGLPAADRKGIELAAQKLREVIAQHALAPACGATSPHPQVVVVRVMAPVVEPAMDLLRSLRNVWRTALWGIAPSNPRIWSM